jgi:glycosyltransferase involved in cell wall biosynthesis
MRCPRLTELPAPPSGKTGWPWTEETPPLAEMMPDGQPWPLMSIVTPSYNQGQYLEETIRSVLLQGYPRIEYFVLDGASTDDSVDIIKRYAPWLTYWISEADDGQSDAINKGFAQASGSIIAWINSDDAYLASAFEQVAQCFRVHPDAALIYGKSADYNDDGMQFGQGGRPFDLATIFRTINNPIPQSSAFISHDAWSLAGPLRIDLEYNMDLEYWYRLAFLGEVIFVDVLWSKFRLYPQSKTGSNTPRSIEIFEIIHKDLLNRPDLPDELVVRKSRALALLHIKCARRYAWNRQWDKMKEHVNAAFAADWRAIFWPWWRRMMLLSLFGMRGANVISAVKVYLRDQWHLPFPSIG